MAITETKPKRKRERIPQTSVLGWLQTNHPELHKVAEIERAWIWLPTGKERLSEAVFKSITTFGFVLSRKGHLLPSGSLGVFGHSCERPIPFRRRHGGQLAPGRPQPKSETTETPEPETTDTTEIDEALAFALAID
jgi:hypothetical protein